MSVINTNYLALVSQNNLNKSQSALGTAIERLSSGLRINSAKDDAAGQAIANRMNAQVQGLNQAARNANDGISAAQTTEGALNQINDNLNRIRVLTVQAENGSNSDDDLTSIQNEINQRLSEINRISDETEFNGRKVLASGSDLQIQVGANDGQKISIGMKKINTEELGLSTFNVNGNGASANSAATSDSLTLAGFTNVGKVNGSDQFERTSTTTNTQAGASDIVSRMSAGDTVTVAGVNNGLGVATGDTYTYNAASDRFSFDVAGVSSSDVASFINPPAGTRVEASITLGGTAQVVLIDSQGKITNTDNQALYLDTTGNLTLNGGAGADPLPQATLESLAARMSAPSTDAPTTSVTTAGENEVNTVKFGALAAGESVTVGGLTYTASGAEAAGAVAGKFANYGTDQTGFTGSLDAGWTMADAVTNGDEVEFTSTQTGDVANISAVAVGAAGAPVNAVNTRPAADAIATVSTVKFAALADGDTVTVGGVTFTATGAVDADDLADAFKAYFDSGTIIGGTFDPAGGSGMLEGFTVATNANSDELVFTRTDGALSGIATSGKITSNTVTTPGSDAVTDRDTVTFGALSAGQQFSIQAGGGKEITFTASANMTDAEVASAFAAALQDQASLEDDTRFSGTWDFDGDNGWTVQAAGGNSVTFESQYAGSDPTNATNLTSTTRVAAGAQPTVTETTAAAAEVTEVTFNALSAGQGVTVNGMTLTAKADMTADDVALAFQQKSTNSYEGTAATFTGSFQAGFTVSAGSTNDTLTVTANVAGVSSGVTTSSPSSIGSGSIAVNGATFTVNGNAFDVTGASIGAEGLVTEAAGKAYTMDIAAGDAAGSYSVDVDGGVSRGGDTLYVSGTELTTEETSETKETYFAHANGNVTDAAGNRIYQDAQSDTGFSTKATTPGTRTDNALDALDSAIAMVDAFRSDLGAIQNRFQSAIQNLTTTATNLAAAQSRIQDADYAVEVANMTRAQILQQAGTSVLAQANQIPQGVLSLLR